MKNVNKLPKPQQVSSWKEEMVTMSYHIRQKALSKKGALNILEAGCGNMWGLDMEGAQYTLTGVDLDKDALEIRMKQQMDLDIGILGDLRYVNLEENKYDVIYNSYVLEHIKGRRCAKKFHEMAEAWRNSRT